MDLRSARHRYRPRAASQPLSSPTAYNKLKCLRQIDAKHQKEVDQERLKLKANINLRRQEKIKRSKWWISILIKGLCLVSSFSIAWVIILMENQHVIDVFKCNNFIGKDLVWSVFRTECCREFTLDFDDEGIDKISSTSFGASEKSQKLLRRQLHQISDETNKEELALEDHNPIFLIFNDNREAPVKNFLFHQLLPDFGLSSENFVNYSYESRDEFGLQKINDQRCPYKVIYYENGRSLSNNFTKIVNNENFSKSIFIIDFEFPEDEGSTKVRNLLESFQHEFTDAASEEELEELQERVERIIRGYIYSVESRAYFQEGRFQNLKLLSVLPSVSDKA